MAIREKAITDVEINGQNASTVLDQLKNKADGYRKAMVEANKANDLTSYKKAEAELKKTERTMGQLKKATFDVNQVMRNLSSTSANDLTRAQRQIQAELKKTTRGTAEYIAKSKQLRMVGTEIRKVRSEMTGLSGAQSGMFGKMANGFNKYFGLIAGGLAALTGLSMGFRKLSEDAMEFQSRVANLSALTGLEGSSLDWLAEKAKSLSVGVTEDGVRITKSANDIVDAFTLMGSAKPELLKNKEALALVTTEALKLAESAKMDTKTAVESLANVMNQFGAGADQASKYINVLAAGSKEGAAAVDSIAASIIKFGPAAASANISVEESVGLIETLAEKGVKGEIAGTQLRTALLKLQTGADEFNPKVVGLNQALENLNNANLSAGELVKMFGQEAYLAGAILIDNKDKVDSYTKAVTNTNVATEQAVKNTQTMAVRLEQARNKMQLASLDLGQRFGGALVFSTNMVRKLIEGLISADKVFKRWRKGVPQSFSDAAIKIRDEQTAVNRLVMQLTDANTKEAERKKIVDELNAISPSLVKNLDSENISLVQLKDNLKAYNEEATNRIIIANLQEEEEKSLADLAKKRQTLAETQFLLQEKILATNEDIALSEGTFNEKLAATTKYLQQQIELQRQEGELGKRTVNSRGVIIDSRTREQKLLQDISNLSSYLVQNEKDLAESEGTSLNYKQRIEALKEILGLNKEISTVDGEGTDGPGVDPVAAEMSKYSDLQKALETHTAEERLIIMRSYLQGLTDKEERDAQLQVLEIAHLEALLALQKQYGEETYDTEYKLTQEKIKLMESVREANQRILDQMLKDNELNSDKLIEQNIADTDAAILAEFDAYDAEVEAKRKATEEKMKLDQQAFDAYAQKMEQYKDVAGSMASALGNLLGRAATDAEMTAQEVARELLLIALDSLHGIVQIAMAEVWTKAIAQGPLAIAGAIAKTAAIEMVFAGVKAAVSNVGQRYAGKYDVIGEDDGRTYRNVPYQGEMKTGIYGKPTLVAERGPELIVDAGTLRNVSVNFPDVLPKIRASMVPQRAAGNVAERTNQSISQSANQPINQSADPELKALLYNINQLFAQGIAARIEYSKIEDANTKVSKIRSEVSRS